MATDEILDNVNKDFEKVNNILKIASIKIKKNNFEYPIFIMSYHFIDQLPLLITKNKKSNNFYYYATYLDLLYEKKILDPQKRSFFIEKYKDPSKFCCLFLIDEKINKLIFCPYKNI